MSEIQNYKFHSTGQFRNVVKNIKTQAQFKGVGEDGNPIMDRTAIAPTVTYVGTVKLHGTNGSIIVHEDGVLSFHSKNNLLGYVKDDEFTLLNDNVGFAAAMNARLGEVKSLIENIKSNVKQIKGEITYPLKISGEWCGQGIQKGVGISYLSKRSFFVFGVKCGETDQATKQGWLPLHALAYVVSEEINEAGIYSITDFPTKFIDIDFNNAEFSQNTLVEYTESCEECCPVSEVLQLKDEEGKPTLLGEGYVWTPVSEEYCWDSGNYFKTKGKKHSVSKVKSVAAVCPEKLESVSNFVDYAVTTNRLEQGVQEVGLDQKLIGKFIGWVNKDIHKEETDVLEENNLTMKDVGKFCSNKAREFYLNKLNNNF